MDLARVRASVESLVKAISSLYVGRAEVIRLLLATLIAGGHVLLEGPPGLGKTTLAKLFAQAIGGEFKRVQMTPDLLPSDIIGTVVWDQKASDFKVRLGPIFANVVLVDELNRATPRTQSALLEAMEERQVTIDVNTIKLPEPFIVIATQVPADIGGVFPLTVTQRDRFAVKAVIGLPSREEEAEILARSDALVRPQLSPAITLDDVRLMSEAARSVKVDSAITEYILSIIEEARKLSTVEPVSVRASIWLYRLSRAMALLDGRDFVIPDDVKSVAPHVLRHRLVFGPEGAVDPDSAITGILSRVQVPRY